MEEKLKIIDAYFNAANYISACQLYLLDNPLLKRKLTKGDIKKKIVGHWGTVPAQNFIYAHLNRLIKDYDLNMIYISGPGHGGNSPVANTYLEGTYSEIYKEITYDEEGLKKLFKSFSFPGGIPSHAAPETPGSIHEGGELGYSLAHAFGAVLDNPDLIAATVIGDGEAETGPLATAWNGIKFLNPKKDGIVLPIINLNGYKISNPTVLARMTKKELGSFFYGLGYHPYLVEADDIREIHRKMYITLEKVMQDIKDIKNEKEEVLYPMIILKTPKGWTCPSVVRGRQIEGTFRAHQVPLQIDDDEDVEKLEKWLRSYHPEELFDENGCLLKEIRDHLPKEDKRMGSNPNANGGKKLKELKLPDIYEYAVKYNKRGIYQTEDMIELSKYLRDTYRNNDNFRLFSPDEAMSNRLYRIFDVQNRDWQKQIQNSDEYLSKNGKIMDSYLSEHMCEGMLEGYLLTGRHGLFVSYEAFIRVIDSMASQHAKWLKVCNEIPWRKDIASLNYILTSHIWQQDHNGYTHQEPGFLNHIADKKDAISRIYLPFDANSLIVTVNHALKTKNKINVITASKHPSYQWLTMSEAEKHLKNGVSIWGWASTYTKDNPDIVIASAGDTPVVETLAAVSILNKELPKLKIRYVNVLDLMKLKEGHPHGLPNEIYNELFTQNKPIIFVFHGYPSLIYSLTHNRQNKNITVHGYEEEGSITTPFDMRARNKIDRYHIVIDVVKKLNLNKKGDLIIEKMLEKLEKNEKYIKENGIDMGEIKDWHWQGVKKIS
ncbi:MAG: phosphoketolase family protein [Bacilli bacterium]|nr:phosphoketolase family protein [Bacilli bacterium]